MDASFQSLNLIPPASWLNSRGGCLKSLRQERVHQKVRERVGKELAEGLVEGLAERLAESQRRILILASQNPSVSKRELADAIEISTTAIDENIAQLKKKGLIKRIGGAKGGHWEVLDERNRE